MDPFIKKVRDHHPPPTAPLTIRQKVFSIHAFLAIRTLGHPVLFLAISHLSADCLVNALMISKLVRGSDVDPKHQNEILNLDLSVEGQLYNSAPQKKQIKTIAHVRTHTH